MILIEKRISTLPPNKMHRFCGKNLPILLIMLLVISPLQVAFASLSVTLVEHSQHMGMHNFSGMADNHALCLCGQGEDVACCAEDICSISHCISTPAITPSFLIFDTYKLCVYEPILTNQMPLAQFISPPLRPPQV
ncbi:MAG: hypothetical protein KZQ72_15660, partial [Candidatus Thiodiazotropha sp. (ex Cardiolucina cf. quadrata)]|nr:hypothetical protein [Candidatus Thiodiazotropha sp. (ex Cardiolucina cf. quadrata)]